LNLAVEVVCAACGQHDRYDLCFPGSFGSCSGVMHSTVRPPTAQIDQAPPEFVSLTLASPEPNAETVRAVERARIVCRSRRAQRIAPDCAMAPRWDALPIRMAEHWHEEHT